MQVFGHPTWLSTLKNHVFATDLYVATVLRSPRFDDDSDCNLDVDKHSL